MPKSAWATGAEVAAMMVSSGLASAAPSADSIAPYILAAIEEWERKTGWRPFLEGASADWRYDPPAIGRTLDLQAGFTEISAVRTGLNPTDSTGTLLTAESDYELRPVDARAIDRPYYEIKFIASPGSGSKSIKVTGKKGFDNLIADEVWLAVARRSAFLAIGDLTSGGDLTKRIKQGPVEIEFSSGGSTLERWAQALTHELISGYQRMVI